MTNKEFDLICIGNAIVDAICYANDDFLMKNGMIKGSMQLIDDERAKIVQSLMNEAKYVSGGSAANTACAFAMLGGKAGFIGKVNEDFLGEKYRADIEKSGVKFLINNYNAKYPTGACYIFVSNADAERTMNTYLGAASTISMHDIDLSWIERTSMLYLEGYIWDKETTKQTIRSILSHATKVGTKVALTLSDLFCVDRHRDEFLELITNHCDIVFANEFELMSLFLTENIEYAMDQALQLEKLFIVTRSENGSVILNDKSKIYVDAVLVNEVIDQTGAGDVYASGFLYGLSNGNSLVVCGKLASSLAAEIVSIVGSRLSNVNRRVV